MRQSSDQESQDLRLDAMLRGLRDSAPSEPSAEIRENLLSMTMMANHRMTSGHRLQARLHWIRFALLSVTCATVLVAIGLHYLPLLNRKPANLSQTPDSVTHAAPTPALVRDLPVHHLAPQRVRLVHHEPARPSSLRTRANETAGINLELPYSNRDIANGTGTTIQIAISREELMALGVSLGETSTGGRYLAELTLGDDGLPRAIHIPVPLRTIN